MKARFAILGPLAVFLLLLGTCACHVNVRNVTSYGATGDGTTDDTAAINSAISALQPGYELYFPCGTYRVSSALKPIVVQNVTVAGTSGCTTLKGSGSGYSILQVGADSLTAATPLTAAAGELSTTFSANFSSLGGLAADDYVVLQEGGKDYSSDTTPGHDSNCDVSGCRGEVVQIQSVSGSTATVTTALHYPYEPLGNAAKVAKIPKPVNGAVVKDLVLDGSGTVSLGLYMVGVVNATVANVSATNFVNWGLLSHWAFNLAWNNIAISHAGNGGADAFLLYGQGRPSVNGASLSNLNPNAFGMGIHTTADGTFTNVTIDKSGTSSGRPFKTTAASYNSFNSLTVKNGMGSTGYNGISLEYYSSHNTFNHCVVTNNSAYSGIMGFGNYNQYNKFVNCTVSGNAQWQLGHSKSALGQFNDTHWEISGGTYTGAGDNVIHLNGSGAYVHDVSVNGPWHYGIYIGGNETCVTNNKFNGRVDGYDIADHGSGNVFARNATRGPTEPALLPAGACPVSKSATL